MKKMLFAVCALAAISLLAPNAGFAQQWWFKNRIGIYTTEDAHGACINPTPINTPWDIFFVVCEPVGVAGPLAWVAGFEFLLTVQNNGSLMFRLAEGLPPGAVNDGTYTNQYNAEFAVRLAAPLPVADGMCKLMKWNVMALGAGPFRFFLSPADPASVAGMLAVTAADWNGNAELVGCMPSSGAFDEAVFAIGTCDVVGVESESFGNVKALFR